MYERSNSPFQPAWIFVLVLVFWIICILREASLSFIVVSGVFAFGAWFLLFMEDRDERQARAEIDRLKAEANRHLARVAELETDLGLRK